VNEIGREDAAGLGGQELLLGRAGATLRRVHPGIMQDLPHRGGGDLVAELALHTTVPPTRIVVAMRITSLRIEAVVDGRPGRRRLL